MSIVSVIANARHSKAGCFVQQRLFGDLPDFAELERRVANLPDEQSRGDAFEVFAEAYLATQTGACRASPTLRRRAPSPPTRFSAAGDHTAPSARRAVPLAADVAFPFSIDRRRAYGGVRGNNRHGTANSDAMPYVTGSINYGNTRALNFTSGADRVVVPDSSGNFNFSDSFTFEAVARTTSSTTGAAIQAKNGTSDGEGCSAAKQGVAPGEWWWRINTTGTQQF